MRKCWFFSFHTSRAGSPTSAPIEPYLQCCLCKVGVCSSECYNCWGAVTALIYSLLQGQFSLLPQAARGAHLPLSHTTTWQMSGGATSSTFTFCQFYRHLLWPALLCCQVWCRDGPLEWQLMSSWVNFPLAAGCMGGRGSLARLLYPSYAILYAGPEKRKLLLQKFPHGSHSELHGMGWGNMCSWVSAERSVFLLFYALVSLLWELLKY